MKHYPSSVQTLIKNFSKFPGIGTKTAERFAMHILKSPVKEAYELSESIIALKKQVRLCSKCFALSDYNICEICADVNRNNSQICIVETPADMAAIEKSRSFFGVYHILQGALSPIDGINPEFLRIKEFLSRISTDNVKEIIIATSTNFEGEATAAYLIKILKKYKLKLTRIATGIPMGGDLKYIDKETIKCSMETRHDIRF